MKKAQDFLTFWGKYSVGEALVRNALACAGKDWRVTRWWGGKGRRGFTQVGVVWKVAVETVYILECLTHIPTVPTRYRHKIDLCLIHNPLPAPSSNHYPWFYNNYIAFLHSLIARRYIPKYCFLLPELYIHYMNSFLWLFLLALFVRFTDRFAFIYSFFMVTGIYYHSIVWIFLNLSIQLLIDIYVVFGFGYLCILLLWAFLCIFWYTWTYISLWNVPKN